MHIEFWGTRGSIAKPGPTTLRYGGNTSCVEVRSASGTLIVIDCGTGAHALGQRLAARSSGAVDGHLLISHTHWDHIQGMPFFAPLFAAGNVWDVYGPRGLSQSLRNTLAGQMEHTYFPVALDQFAATIRYHDLVEGSFSIDDVKVKTRYLNHPALTLAYRLEADGASVVYCCDHEPHSTALAAGETPITGADRGHVDFIAGADLVIHDAQYTAHEYPAKIGWGHSPVEYVLRVCTEAGVKRVVLTHHDPLRDDDAVEQLIVNARLRLRKDAAPLEILAAAEGLSIEVSGALSPPPERAQPPLPATTVIDMACAEQPVYLCLADHRLRTDLTQAVTVEGLACRFLASDAELLSAVLAQRPALVMVEHQPPLVDGLETARAIRRIDDTEDGRIPVVLVTSGHHPAGRDNTAVTDWLSAPFSLSYARTKIRAWVLRTACRWISAPLPATESRRLRALRDLAILDTACEERFDRVTRIASAAFDTPIALVSLVDSERQWFKSCFGLDARETSRDVSFCAHIVHRSEELVVSDALQDERFADNPLVAGEPRIRFYAGAPLVLDGSCLGTLCVIDTRPRELSQTDLRMLRDLRDLVLEELRRTRA